MPRLWNIDHQTAVVRDKNGERVAVAPGDPFDFPDEPTVVVVTDEAGDEIDRVETAVMTAGGTWSDHDPRAGLAEEQEFKAKRDRKAKSESDPVPSAPAEAEEAPE